MPDFPIGRDWPPLVRRDIERRRLRVRRQVPQSLQHLTGFSILACGHAIGRGYELVLAPLHLSIKEFVVLAVATETPDIPTLRVGERLGLSPQRASEIVKVLAARELIERVDNWRDGRQKRVRLSTSGTDLFNRALTDLTEADTRWQNELDAEERGALTTALLRLSPKHGEQFRQWWRRPT